MHACKQPTGFSVINQDMLIRARLLLSGMLCAGRVGGVCVVCRLVGDRRVTQASTKAYTWVCETTTGVCRIWGGG